MNIQEAKDEIRRTITAYTSRNDLGCYSIPSIHQRPLLLIGPPGIGKTAIVSQVAEEMGLCLVSYTMTHHTRQSAIGLPAIDSFSYGNESFPVTSYTMSEIVASIYKCMKEQGKDQGILFLDEINCVSETLAPVILQLLQTKTFGTHRIPQGWVIVAAGNPPEYNKSVKEFDMVTLDRVRSIDLEASLSVWQNYMKQKGIHPSISAFLQVHPSFFYLIEKEDGASAFVTARGWEDLSYILRAYEAGGETIYEELVFQYLHHTGVSRKFFLFYQLFSHYFTILNEDDLESQGCRHMVAKAEPAEATSLALLLASRLKTKADQWYRQQTVHHSFLESYRLFCSQESDLESFINQRKEAALAKDRHGLLSPDDLFLEHEVVSIWEDLMLRKKLYEDSMDPHTVFTAYIREKEDFFQVTEASLLQEIDKTYSLLSHANHKPALSCLTAELAAHDPMAFFLADHPSEAFLGIDRQATSLT